MLLKYGHSDSDPSWSELRIRNCYWKISFSLLEHEVKTTSVHPSRASTILATQRSTRKLLPLFHIRTIILYEFITVETHKPSSKAPHHEASTQSPQHVTRNPKRDHTPSKNDKPHHDSKKPSQPEHGTRKSGHSTQPHKSYKLGDIERDIWMFASATPKVKKYCILINFLNSEKSLPYI